MNPIIRAITMGLVGLSGLFAVDAWDSYRLFRRSTMRIRTDQATLDLLTGAVTDYVGRVAVAYILLGVLAGIGVHLATRLWFPETPSAYRWWTTAFIVLLSFFGLGYLEQAAAFPAMYDTMPGVAWWADTVRPEQVTTGSMALALAVFGIAALRWRQASHATMGVFAKRAAALGAWLGLCAVALHNPTPTPTADNDVTNVVIIGVDSLRPDHLGFYGYDRKTAPNIDALLAESVTFDSAWTPLARTFPAWTSILSGMLPINNGIRDNLPEPDEVVAKVPLLPQVLKDAGWTTTFVTDDSRFSYMLPEMGFDRIVQPLPNLKNFAVSLNEPRFRAFSWLMHNPLGFSLLPTAAYNQAFSRSYRPELFIDAAVDALGETSRVGKPFFYAVHSCVLHAPAERPYPWHQMWGQGGYTGGNRFRYSKSGTVLLEDGKKVKRTRRAKQAIAEQDVRIYDSGIDMADRLVGSVVSSLKASGLWDNTIVVLLSDHGEEHWDRKLPYKFNGPNHGFHAYGDGQHQVVLAIRTPDGALAGTRVKAPVRLFDLVPTLNTLLGIQWPGELDGVDALLAPDETDTREVYIETGVTEPGYWKKGHKKYPFKRLSAKYAIDEATGRVNIKPSFLPHLIAAKDRVMQVGRWKLVWHSMEQGGEAQLFDREADPLNRKDLSQTHPEILADLLGRMTPYLERDGLKVVAAP